MSLNQVSTKEGGLVAVVFALSIFVSIAAFVILASPGDLGPRLEVLASQSRQLKALRVERGDAYAYPPQAVCVGDPAVAGAHVQEQITETAQKLGVTILEFRTQPAIVMANLGTVTRTDWGLSVRGPEGAALGMIAGLNKVRPALFVDRLDLKPDAGDVSLKFEGRLYCQSAPLS